MTFNIFSYKRIKLISTIFLITLLVTFSNVLAITIFGEDFNSLWSTTNPPPGWRITFTGDTSTNDWHRKDANRAPWSTNSTPYACLIGSQTSGDSPDSLISPIIDCSNYYNITLRCSTNFSPFSGAYRASLIGSTDGGITWTYNIIDYTNRHVPPQLEITDLPWAINQPHICFAWVFEGEPAGLSFWGIDNVSLTGFVVQDTDIATVNIVRPRRFELPGTITVNAKFMNLGRDSVVNIMVNCEIKHLPDSLTIFVASDTIPLIVAGETYLHYFSLGASLYNGKYVVTVWCDAAGDQDRSNDTLSKIFTVGFKNELGYDDGVSVSDSSWVWERYGWGVKFINYLYPVYPALVESVMFHLSVQDTLSNHFRIRICDDDGIEGSPGTPLYESCILTAVSGWNSYGLSLDSIAIWDSSFYLFSIQVEGQPLSPLLSKDAARNNEASYWACCDTNYVRDFTNGDWMIRCVLNYAFEIPRPNANDFRTVFIKSPEENLVVRPSNRTFIPKARIENWGNQLQLNVPVVCSIIPIGISGTPYVSIRIVDLYPSSDTLLSFRDWSPTFTGQGEIIVRTLLTNDMNPTNDTKGETIFVHQSAFIGQDYSIFDYRWIDSDTISGPTYSWIDTCGHMTEYARWQGDEQTWFTPVWDTFNNFTIRYYDTTYRNLWVSDNGWIQLGPWTGFPPPAYPNNTSVPDTLSPNNTIYAFWDDLRFGPTYGGGGIFFKKIGAYPNRKFVVIYQDVRRSNAPNSDPITFEVIFSENGMITIQYKDVFCSDARYNFGRSATIGIEDYNGEYGLQYLYGDGGDNGYYPGNKLNSGRAIKIYSTQINISEEPQNLTSSTTLVEFSPNPFKNLSQIRLQLKKGGTVNLKIYDVSGKIIRNLINTILKPGNYNYYWDAHDDKGRKVSNGIYFFKLETPDQKFIQKLILVK